MPRSPMLLICALALAAGCKTLVLVPAPEHSRASQRHSTAASLGIPPGHLPRAGECRIWIPGVPPGRQRGHGSRDCSRLARQAPAGSWVVYRPTRDKKLVHVRVVDERRPGVIVTVRIFDVDSGRFIREERP